jgi:UDP-glucuronate 4-epimerase
MSSYLITGVAGFIGFHLAQKLLAQGNQVVGFDCFTDYYDVNLKRARIAQISDHKNFRFLEMNVADQAAILDLFRKNKFDCVVNLAGQAGVRYSLVNPHAYINANVIGFLNILEACRHFEARHLIFASSSSVYGTREKYPFVETDAVDHPISLYAATKRANELIAHSYAQTFGVPCTGLRFFSVYGEWGRPDMAYYSFTKSILEARPIELFNEGKHKRDMTYVGDVAETIARLAPNAPSASPHLSNGALHPANSIAPFQIFNVGNRMPVLMSDVVKILEHALGKQAIIKMTPMQPGDAEHTFADCERLEKAIGFVPHTCVEDGLGRFVNWYRGYHRV